MEFIVSMTGMHANCGNEGHPEDQLESLSVSSTLSVGKSLLGSFLTRISKKHHMLPTYIFTPLLGLLLGNSIMELKASEDLWCPVRSAIQNKVNSDTSPNI